MKNKAMPVRQGERLRAAEQHTHHAEGPFHKPGQSRLWRNWISPWTG